MRPAAAATALHPAGCTKPPPAPSPPAGYSGIAAYGGDYGGLSGGGGYGRGGYGSYGDGSSGRASIGVTVFVQEEAAVPAGSGAGTASGEGQVGALRRAVDLVSRVMGGILTSIFGR